MSEPSSSPDRRPLPVLAVVLPLGPLLLGATTAALGDRTPLGAAVLWAEPILLFVALYTVGWLLLESHWKTAVGTILGVAAGGLLQRLPPAGTAPDSTAETWATSLRGCTILPDQVRRPIRVLTWTLDPSGSPPSVPQMVGLDIDLAVLVGLRDPKVAQALAAGLHGESIYLPGESASEGLGLVVRGAFQYCGGPEDSWMVELPGAPDEAARAVLTFPEVQGAGVIPLVAVQVSGPGPTQEWLDWPARLVQSSEIVGNLSHALGPRRVVLAGDFGAPRTFRDAASPLVGAGLHEVLVPASWPTQVGPVALPGLHALDRVWTGGAWSALAARRAPAALRHARAPILVDLAPAEPHAH